MTDQPTLFHAHEHSSRLETRCTHWSTHLKGKTFYASANFRAVDCIRPGVAIVGTRRPTSYGIRFVREFVQALVGQPWTLLSGGAYGIDCEAHMAALRAGLSTHAWVVGPLARPSPQGNAALFAELRTKPGCGLFVPALLEPANGSAVQKSHWLQRNQWLAAAADALVVVEATLGSGTWSTAKAAADMGIPVFVLPGSVFSSQSTGVNSMISQGCGQPILSIGNLVKCLVAQLGGKTYNYNTILKRKQQYRGGALAGQKQAFCLQTQPKLIDQLRTATESEQGFDLKKAWTWAAEARYPVEEVLNVLSWMVEQGELIRAGDRFERGGPL